MKARGILNAGFIGSSGSDAKPSILVCWKWGKDKVKELSIKLIVFVLFGLISLSSIIIFSTMQIADSSANRLAMDQIDSNMRVAWHLLHELGAEVSIVDGRLRAGTTVINDNSILVDELRNTVGGVATIFQDDKRISTTVRDLNGRLGVSTYLAQGPVYTILLKEHKSFRGIVNVLGSQYFSGYDPIFDRHGAQVGILYVGIKKSDLLGDVTRARLITVAASAGCIFLIVVFFLFIGRHLFRKVSHYEQNLQDVSQRLAIALESSTSVDHDADQARRRVSNDTASQRLLAAMFNRISVPVLLIQTDGSIIISNPAYQGMIGYSAQELIGRNVNEFTPPEYLPAARSIWSAETISCGYEREIDIITRSGARLPLRVKSNTLPANQDQRLRVVTLLPRHEPYNALTVTAKLALETHDPAGARLRSVGQVQAVSLAAIRAATGGEWSQVAARAMSMAEEVIRHRLGKRDIVCRNGEDGFIIWFDDSDEDKNNAILDAAIRELRLKFLTHFGEEVSNHASAVLVTATEGPTGGHDLSNEAPLSTALLEQFTTKRKHHTISRKELLEEVRDLPIGNIDAVIDRDGKIKPLVVVDLPIAMRRRLSMLSTASIQETDPGADIDFLRLKLAVRQINDPFNRTDVLVPISWQALVSPDRRWSIDECLGKVEIRLRRNLVLAISGVPPHPNDSRWKKILDPFRRQFGNVSLIVTLTQDDPAFVYEAMANDWSLSLLVIDATDRMSAGFEKYFTLIANARKRNIDVLIRVAEDATVSDWRELGATMFSGDTEHLGVAPSS